ncbi:tRNA pseudouridine(55) synthase TruB [Ilumatobacter sp.]|uniref:tRNA pseudouridine(55) synthase TruB n=1 Tax=Ilumatobacter sp. TaxID=1967498 RepID=UPI003AF47927
MARRKPATTHGLCVVDKPAGVTSHDVVGMLRRRFHERQVGHAGTLDPDATGVLVVAVGMTTKLLRFIEKTDKRYVGEVVLGTETTTLDAAGEVTARHDMSRVTLADARRVVVEHLTGDIEQIPPMVSAIRVDGRRLHELAREGIEIEREPRPVTVASFTVDDADETGVFRIDVTCSAGTYIRTLAADLGHLLGGGAHLRDLRRTAVGAFTLDEAGHPDECELLPVATAARSLERVVVDDATAKLVANGRVLPRFAGDGPWALFDDQDVLLAVYESFRTDQAKPSVVLPTAIGR